MKTAMLLVFLTLAGGCANYRYAVVSPDGQSRDVQEKLDLVIPATPAELRVREFSDRCVIMIENPTAEPIQLDGGQSTLVDPSGETRAIGNQLIPPGAFTKLILPPLRQNDPRGPEFRIGFGVMVRTEAPPPGPRESVLLSVSGPVEYWEWSGAGEVRLVLSFVQGEKTTRHALTIRRWK